MLEIRDKLQKQNQAIRRVENEKNEVYMELSECKGIFKGDKRKQLQEKYDALSERVKNMQAGLGKSFENMDIKVWMSSTDYSMLQ